VKKSEKYGGTKADWLKYTFGDWPSPHLPHWCSLIMSPSLGQEQQAGGACQQQRVEGRSQRVEHALPHPTIRVGHSHLECTRRDAHNSKGTNDEANMTRGFLRGVKVNARTMMLVATNQLVPLRLTTTTRSSRATAAVNSSAQAALAFSAAFESSAGLEVKLLFWWCGASSEMPMRALGRRYCPPACVPPPAPGPDDDEADVEDGALPRSWLPRVPVACCCNAKELSPVPLPIPPLPKSRCDEVRPGHATDCDASLSAMTWVKQAQQLAAAASRTSLWSSSRRRGTKRRNKSITWRYAQPPYEG
jgi:hypothetical protein